MSGRLARKVAVVTGGTSGIGEATVRRFVEEGARVVVVARHRDAGERLAGELGNDAVTFLAGDVAVESTAVAAMEAAGRLGGIDVLVNNAAMDWTSNVVDTAEADLRRVLDVNFIGAFLMLREAGRVMLQRGHGSIINITSRNASIGVATMAAYASAKGALLALTRAAAVEWAATGVRVNAVAPGLTDTPLIRSWITAQPDPASFESEVAAKIPQRRMAEPLDVANAIVFLASDESSHITGASIAVDGGYTAA